MATRYFARECIYTGQGPDLSTPAAVFATDDLTQDECKTLAASVQRCLDELEEQGGHGPWFFEMGPSAQDDPVVFINLKSQWNQSRAGMEGYRTASGNSWMSEIYWFYEIAREHADIVRGMRASEIPTVYLQCDGGRGFTTFDCVDCLTGDEIEVLEKVLGSKLHESGMQLRIITDWHANREPAMYVAAKMSWEELKLELEEDGDSDEFRMAASYNSESCVKEILALRRKPIIYRPDDGDENDADAEQPTAETLGAETNGKPAGPKPLAASEERRAGYRDPDNYWRNVWMYEQRKAGMTNTTILAGLEAKGKEFAPIETYNALRTAIDSIAVYHNWPLLKGKGGRPRSKNWSAETPQ